MITSISENTRDALVHIGTISTTKNANFLAKTMLLHEGLRHVDMSALLLFYLKWASFYLDVESQRKQGHCGDVCLKSIFALKEDDTPWLLSGMTPVPIR